MLWPHCLHDWIWYFSHGCRQRWGSWGMCDRRALWPPWLHVFLSCLGPKTWAIAPLSVYSRSALCDKPQPTATHSQRRKWQPWGRSLPSQTTSESGAFSPFGALQTGPWLPPPWEWASVRPRTCHVHVNQVQQRVCTSVTSPWSGQTLTAICWNPTLVGVSGIICEEIPSFIFPSLFNQEVPF